MKKAVLLLLTLALMLGAAQAESFKIDGAVEAVTTHSILAPYTGDVRDFTARVGDELAGGEVLFTLSAQAVYADFNGTVTAVFAQDGDKAESVQERYDALCYIERNEKYRVSCTGNGAHNDEENKIIHVGERVYVRSRDNDSRKGTGIVIGVDGSSYTLELTDSGKLKRSDVVKVYRDPDFTSTSCIGMGSLKRIEPVGVTADGWVRSVYVEGGQQVHRGDLLFMMVPDALENMNGSDGIVAMPEDGILLSVNAESGAQMAKDAVMATYCRPDDLRVVCPAEEDDLADLTEGMSVVVTLDGCGDAEFDGVIEKIAAVGNTEGNDAKFDVIVSLSNPDGLRVGMSATLKGSLDD